jgi:hypothetical protein
MQASNFYIYEHIRPDTGMVFYVGKGSGDRATVKHNRNPYWKNVVNKTKAFSVRKICKTENEELAFLIEQERIDQLKRLDIKLTNLTDGGEGAYNPSNEVRLKMSQSKFGQKNPRFNENSLRQRRLRGELKVPKEVMSANMRANHWSKTGKFSPKGLKRSEQAKINMCGKRDRISGGNNPKAKIIVYDDKEFLCIKDFASFLNVNYGTLLVKIRVVGRTVFTTDDYDSLTNGRIAFNGV